MEQPIKYVDLPDNIKESLAAGHVLAEHTVQHPDPGTIDKHITTVILNAAQDGEGRSVMYCFECDDVCERGSVRLLTAEMPKREEDLWRAPLPFDTGKVRAWEDSIAMEEADPLMKPTEAELIRADVLASLDDDVNEEAARRLEMVRAWEYERYRIVIHHNPALATAYASSLFIVETGLRISDNHALFGRFLEFLHDSVIVEDAETLPVFPPEQDCGE